MPTKSRKRKTQIAYTKQNEFLPYFEYKKKTVLHKRYKRVRWNDKEHLRYIQFLSQNQNRFDTQQIRRETKVFVKASLYIKTKSYKQVKSHHQKMMLKFKSIEGVINSKDNDQIMEQSSNWSPRLKIQENSNQQNNVNKVSQAPNKFDINIKIQFQDPTVVKSECKEEYVQ